jgi:hypothetical protein
MGKRWKERCNRSGANVLVSVLESIRNIDTTCQAIASDVIVRTFLEWRRGLE